METEAIGDADGNGVPDIVLGRRGSLTLHSGKGGEILATFTGEGGLGEEFAAIGDLDGDGLSEILVGAPDGGYALVVSFGEDKAALNLSITRLLSLAGPTIQVTGNCSSRVIFIPGLPSTRPGMVQP